jgi:Tfp pilus assembly protein PilE
MKTTSRGFTVVEVIVVALLFGIASIIFFVQKASIETAARDEQRKTAINAIHYGLEEVYFKEVGSYPRTISDTTLRSVDPALLNDTAGIKIGESDSEYRYEAVNCNGNRCQEYTLRTTLENEADYVKTQRDSDN